MAKEQIGPHIYVVAEDGCACEPRPVKIGMHDGPASAAGAPGISRGNWRELRVVHRLPLPLADLRWSEWLIHRRLWSRHIRGEWFDVRDLVHGDDWAAFLDGVLTESIPGLDRWKLANDGHELVAMRRVTSSKEPRQFAAVCSCGVTVQAPERTGLSTAQIRFAVDHLGLSLKHPEVTQLKRQVHHKII